MIQFNILHTHTCTQYLKYNTTQYSTVHTIPYTYTHTYSNIIGKKSGRPQVLTQENVRALRESVVTLTKTLEHIENITGDVGGLTGDSKVGLWGLGFRFWIYFRILSGVHAMCSF